jgi:hypothetical protein
MMPRSRGPLTRPDTSDPRPCYGAWRGRAAAGQLGPFRPGGAARITAQCLPGGDGRLPRPVPVFRRLATDAGGRAPGR